MSGLTVSRKVNEQVQITLADGQRIDLSIVSIKGSQVKLNIEADADVKILRAELIK